MAQLVWIVRVLWLVAAVLPNNLVDNVTTHSDALRYTMTAELWLLWAVVTVALWVHRPVSLTVARCIAPVVTLRMLAGLPDADFSVGSVASATCAVLACMVIFNANYGLMHVQAGAYGNEKRWLLKVPAPLLLPMILGWALLVTVCSFTPLLLASGHWVTGGVGVVLSGVLLWRVAPQLHRLTLRWLVRVPAGWLLHDEVVLAENFVVQKTNIVSMDKALAGTEALDLSAMTRGVPIELQLREMIEVRLSPFTARMLKTLDVLHVKAFLVACSRTPLG
jgi:hypothetical protein